MLVRNFPNRLHVGRHTVQINGHYRLRLLGNSHFNASWRNRVCFRIYINKYGSGPVEYHNLCGSHESEARQNNFVPIPDVYSRKGRMQRSRSRIHCHSMLGSHKLSVGVLELRDLWTRTKAGSQNATLQNLDSGVNFLPANLWSIDRYHFITCTYYED